MRKNLGAETLLYPQPVFIVATYDENGKADAMNAGWGGITDSNEITLCISNGRKTVKNALVNKAFTVSMATADTVAPCDYVGLVSGNNTPDKMEKAGFHTTKSDCVNAPIIDELPMAIECILKNYDPENGHMVGEIVNISADESILDEDGKIDVHKLRPITIDSVHNDYLTLGEKVGNAFKDGLALR